MNIEQANNIHVKQKMECKYSFATYTSLFFYSQTEFCSSLADHLPGKW